MVQFRMLQINFGRDRMMARAIFNSSKTTATNNRTYIQAKVALGTTFVTKANADPLMHRTRIVTFSAIEDPCAPTPMIVPGPKRVVAMQSCLTDWAEHSPKEVATHAPRGSPPSP